MSRVKVFDQSIIGLGHTLGMDLIAEGIETQDQGLALRSLGCEFGQGYYWAKPMPAMEASAMLRAAPPRPGHRLAMPGALSNSLSESATWR
ncbi:MAG: EAL domain-containing protein [Nodosilinea sp.]